MSFFHFWSYFHYTTSLFKSYCCCFTFSFYVHAADIIFHNFLVVFHVMQRLFYLNRFTSECTGLVTKYKVGRPQSINSSVHVSCLPQFRIKKSDILGAGKWNFDHCRRVVYKDGYIFFHAPADRPLFFFVTVNFTSN